VPRIPKSSKDHPSRISHRAAINHRDVTATSLHGAMKDGARSIGGRCVRKTQLYPRQLPSSSARLVGASFSSRKHSSCDNRRANWTCAMCTSIYTIHHCYIHHCEPKGQQCTVARITYTLVSFKRNVQVVKSGTHKNKTSSSRTRRKKTDH